MHNSVHPDNSSRYRQEIEFLIFIIILFLAWYPGKYLRIDNIAIQNSLQNFPLLISGIIYIVLYVIITFFIFFSKDLFWLMGAVLFGAVFSTLFICIAEVINAFILFFLARRFGKSYVEKKARGKYRSLYERLGNISFFWLFVFRAAPLIPYRFMDLAAGLTQMHFRKYLTIVIIGSPFKMFWIQYILTGVGRNIFSNPYALVEYFLKNQALLIFSLIYPVLVIAVAFKLRHKK